MSSFLMPWSLEWHYRSRDEALIAFSNHHIYNDQLVTFPSTASAPAIRHELVPYVPEDRQEQKASLEVQRVVELVLEHASRLNMRRKKAPHKKARPQKINYLAKSLKFSESHVLMCAFEAI